MSGVQEAQRLTKEKSKCKSQIQKFYAGKHILLTGCTGYLGTLILEKILHTCTEISKLYILVREKKNMVIEDRLKKLFESEVSLKKILKGDAILKYNYDINADNKNSIIVLLILSIP